LLTLAARLKHVRAALWFVILASLGLVIPGLLIPVFSQVFVDSYLIGRLDGWVRPLLLGMVATAVLRGSPDMAAAKRPAAAGNASVIERVGHIFLARAAFADGVFQPALCR
jgi:ABC-type bacteriocin/lantibiotic exporter with double-glycine peptidase domain